MGGMKQGLAGGVVMPQDCGNPVLDRRTHPVETGKATVLMAKETERGKHAVDRPNQRFRRRFGLVGVGVAKRKQVGQEFEHHEGIARNMPSIGQNLAVEFGSQIPRRASKPLNDDIDHTLA